MTYTSLMILSRTIALLAFLLLPFAAGCNGEPRTEDPAGDRAATGESAETGAADEAVPQPDSVTQRLFEGVMTQARDNNLHERPLGAVMQEVGLQFLEKPYMAGLLDAPSEETLICRLDGFDCVTFLESALALSRSIRAQDYSWEAYARHMQDQRYRNGTMEGYCSRLHYFTDWIADNERRGNVRDITEEIGGIPLNKDLNFMSEHRESYARFATNDSVFQCILGMEDQLGRIDLHYVPQDLISDSYDQLQAGDIVALATDIEGLDVTHTGLVYEHGDGRIGLLHASTSGGVKVSPDLQSYVQDNTNQIGIVVARPIGQ